MSERHVEMSRNGLEGHRFRAEVGPAAINPNSRVQGGRERAKAMIDRTKTGKAPLQQHNQRRREQTHMRVVVVLVLAINVHRIEAVTELESER